LISSWEEKARLDSRASKRSTKTGWDGRVKLSIEDILLVIIVEL
jgi:hypothetical protein